MPLPAAAEETDACFIVRDKNGQALGYFYFEDEPGRRSADVRFKATAVIGCFSSETARSRMTQRRLSSSSIVALREQQHVVHSITSSAAISSGSGIVRPSPFAVLRLMTNSNLVGCSTGRSLGFAPRKILSTYSAARWNRAGMIGP